MGRTDLQVPDDAAPDRESQRGGARQPRAGDRARSREASAEGPGIATAFRPPWWGRNAHVQTVWGPLFRRHRIRWRRERVATADGDFVDLDWADSARADAPLVLLLHGLEGSSISRTVPKPSTAASAAWSMPRTSSGPCGTRSASKRRAIQDWARSSTYRSRFAREPSPSTTAR